MSHNPRVSIQTKIAYPNATSEQHTFDAAYNITKIQTANQTLNYTQDKTGLITSKNSTTYTYDNIGRLTQAGSETFTYDKAGNNLNDNASYNPLNNRFESSDIYTLAYDAMGNLKTKYNKLTKETTTYTFNARNQLIGYTKQDENNQTVKTLEFAYDALGRRVSKTEDGVTQKYLYDGDNIIAILDEQNQVIATLTHDESIDTPLSITNQNGTFYYHRDYQGSIVALTDENGNIVESFAYDNHYGAIISHTKTVETDNPYGYTGREVDADDLYYYRARYYDPTLQRFIGEDPIGFASGDFNRYRYVLNSPVGLVDPWGTDAIEIIQDIWDVGPFDTYNAYKRSQEAMKKSRQSGLDGPHNGPQDAYRHCLWSCLMASDLGVEQAKSIGDNHEAAGNRNGQPKKESDMDKHNNREGRICAVNRPSFDPSSCPAKCKKALKNKRLQTGL